MSSSNEKYFVLSNLLVNENEVLFSENTQGLTPSYTYDLLSVKQNTILKF